MNMNYMEQDNYIYIKVEPTRIGFVGWIFEGYEYLGIVSTINREQGLIAVRATKDTRSAVKNIIEHLPFAYEMVENLEESCNT